MGYEHVSGLCLNLRKLSALLRVFTVRIERGVGIWWIESFRVGVELVADL